MCNYANGEDIPLGFGMALAQNAAALEAFAAMTDEGRRQVLAQLPDLRSKQEMRAYVARLAEKPETR